MAYDRGLLKKIRDGGVLGSVPGEPHARTLKLEQAAEAHRLVEAHEVKKKIVLAPYRRGRRDSRCRVDRLVL